MAARINRTNLSDQWRTRIKTGVLMERLESAAAGKIEMTPTQLGAAKLLLAKLVPDLNRTELGGLDGKPIDTNITVTFKAAPPEQKAPK